MSPLLANVPDLQANVDAVLTLHDEHARLLERVAAAEDEFIRRVDAAHQAGDLDWRGLATAYDQVREWNKTNGLDSCVQRWMAHVHHDHNTLARYAKAVPNGNDGRSWNGDTGWEGIDNSKIEPPKRDGGGVRAVRRRRHPRVHRLHRAVPLSREVVAPRWIPTNLTGEPTDVLLLGLLSEGLSEENSARLTTNLHERGTARDGGRTAAPFSAIVHDRVVVTCARDTAASPGIS